MIFFRRRWLISCSATGGSVCAPGRRDLSRSGDVASATSLDDGSIPRVHVRRSTARRRQRLLRRRQEPLRLVGQLRLAQRLDRPPSSAADPPSSSGASLSATVGARTSRGSPTKGPSHRADRRAGRRRQRRRRPRTSADRRAGSASGAAAAASRAASPARCGGRDRQRWGRSDRHSSTYDAREEESDQFLHRTDTITSRPLASTTWTAAIIARRGGSGRASVRRKRSSGRSLP